MRPYIYTETAFHHEGDFNYLIDLVNASKQAGVDGVKFQVLIDMDTFISSKHKGYESIKKWIFSLEQWKEIFSIVQNFGLDIIMMPLDLKAFDLLSLDYPIKYLELHSVSFYDEELIKKIKYSSIPLILGIGGRTIQEINGKRKYFGSQLQVLLLGIQSFPSQLKEVKIRRISELKKLFPEMEIGYADHSSFDNIDAIVSNDYAYILGARIFEKHITLAEGVKRVDFESAVDKNKIMTIVKRLNFLHDDVLPETNADIFDFSEEEIKYRNRQRVAVASRNLSFNTILTDSHISFKMIDKAGGVNERKGIIGKVLGKAVEKDDIILAADLK